METCFLKNLITIVEGIVLGIFNYDDEKMDELVHFLKKVFADGQHLKSVMKAVGQSVRNHATEAELFEDENFNRIQNELKALVIRPHESELDQISELLTPNAMQGVRRSIGVMCAEMCENL